MSVFILFVIASVVIVYFSAAMNRKIEKEKKVANEQKPKIKELQYFCVKDSGHYVSVWPKNDDIGNNLRFNIAGITFRENIDNYIGERVGILIPEPDNEYDKEAIKVLAGDGKHLGYVPKGMTIHVRNVATLPCVCYIYIRTYIEDGEKRYYTCCYIST